MYGAGWNGVMLCGSVGRRFRGASVGEDRSGRLEISICVWLLAGDYHELLLARG